MSKKKKVLLIIGIIIVIMIIVGSLAGSYLEANLNKLADMKIADVDLSKIEDGTYIGTYKVFPVEAIVNVTVNNHIITKIDLVKHVTGQGQDAEVIPSKVIEIQSLKVDTISGATYSSKVILKAIENALKKDYLNKI